MEIVVVANGEEKVLDAETYGVNENMAVLLILKRLCSLVIMTKPF